MKTNITSYANLESAMEVHGLNVKSWAVAENEPCTQVHLVATMRNGNEFILRLKNRQVVDELIQALEEHRDFVWPARAGEGENGDGGPDGEER